MPHTQDTYTFEPELAFRKASDDLVIAKRTFREGWGRADLTNARRECRRTAWKLKAHPHMLVIIFAKHFWR